ncbi:tetratricopeptide repeat protein [Streptomyces sp. NPDC020362]|uniref:tetratricopeptide repeat protein n=1 Tax=unclassified Streptomyces TaxID=2593676 RepID=UPI0033EA2B4C
MAAAYLTTGQLSAAVELFRRTVADCLERLGPDHRTPWPPGRTSPVRTELSAGTRSA